MYFKYVKKKNNQLHTRSRWSRANKKKFISISNIVYLMVYFLIIRSVSQEKPKERTAQQLALEIRI